MLQDCSRQSRRIAPRHVHLYEEHAGLDYNAALEDRSCWRTTAVGGQPLLEDQRRRTAARSKMRIPIDLAEIREPTRTMQS